MLGEFAKDTTRSRPVQAGLLDGKAVDAAYVKRLGELPPREELLGQFPGVSTECCYQVVGALEALRTSDGRRLL